MCTVTLIPLRNNDFVLTSNRDESPNRVALPPDFYKYNNRQLLYPRDEQSKGSWIAVSDNKRLICLLNGGFENHSRKLKYRLSRGVVVKELLVTDDIERAITVYDFDDIEPFTMVVVEWQTNLKFYELVWDGNFRHFKRLPLNARIWSSSTLYDINMRTEREFWFDRFIKDKDLNAEIMFQFHSETEIKNKDFGVIMDRGFVKTTSITSVRKIDERLEMHYKDLFENTNHLKTIATPLNCI
ncbi:MAG: NRDE family protein [Flavobacteriaceae bacterium]|nr:NRDE family protein [Flavobacteriaceae bacterium]